MIFRLLALVAALAFSVSAPAQTISPQLGGRAGVPPYAFFTQPHAALGQWSQPICQLTAGLTVNSDAKFCRNNPKAGVGINAVTLTGFTTLALPANLPPNGGTGMMFQITHSGSDGPILAPGFLYPGAVQPPECNGSSITSNCWSTTAGITDWLYCLPTNATTIGCSYVLTNMGLAPSGFAVVAHAIGSAPANNATTAAANTVGANLLIVAASCAGTVGTVTSSPANTFTQAVQSSNVNGIAISINYVFAPTTGSSQTVTAACANGFGTIEMLAVSGAQSSPLDLTNSATASSGTTIQPGAVAIATNRELVVTGFVGGSTSGGATIDSGFTITDQIAQVNSVNLQGGLAYLIQTTAATVNPTWSGTLNPTAAIASFKAQ